MRKNTIILILLVYLFSCKQEEKPCVGNNLVVPVELNLIILDKDGKNLIAENTSTALIYFIDDQGRTIYTNKNNGALIKNFEDNNYKYYYSDLGIALASTGNTKTFYLDFLGKVDTIYLDNQINPKYDPCGKRESKYIEKELTFNNKEWEHTDDVIPPVFIVRR